MATITKSELMDKLKAQGRFAAENGTRTFCGQFQSFSKDGDYINILDDDRGGAYRRIKLDTLKWIQVDGVKYGAADIVDEVRVVFKGEDCHPLVNGHYLQSLEAHNLLLGDALEEFSGNGLDGYEWNRFTIDGRSLTVRFSARPPYKASNQHEMMQRLKARIEDVRAAFAKKEPYTFEVGGVTFTEGVDDYAPGSKSYKGDALAEKLLEGFKMFTPWCKIASIEAQTFRVYVGEQGYVTNLKRYEAPETFADFEPIVRERYAQCKAIVEEAKTHRFTVEGVEIVVPHDADYQSFYSESKAILTALGVPAVDQCDAHIVGHRMQGFQYYGAVIRLSEYDEPTSAADFERIVRARVKFVKSEIERIDAKDTLIEVVPIVVAK